MEGVLDLALYFILVYIVQFLFKLNPVSFCENQKVIFKNKQNN